ncbi:DUF1330 domain-containing protein [Algoriphagus namhaensis]
MPAYILAEIDIHDPELYTKYTQKTPATILKHGGEFVIRGNPVLALEGEWKHDRLVLLQFETAEAARTWYHSTEYQQAKELRIKASSGKVLLIEV